MDLSRTVSEIDDNFSLKSQNFPTPVYLKPPLKRFTLELGIGARGQKARTMGVPDGQRSFKIRLAV